MYNDIDYNDIDKIRVTLDVTGMYFFAEVKVSKTATIKDVMDAAVAQTASTFPKLTYSEDNKHFLSNITVTHSNGTAKSRQRSKVRPDGVYSYTDEQGTNQPQLVWQYYVSDKNGVLKTGQAGGTRRIIPFTAQNHLEDGDIIVWRLVGIFTGQTGEQSKQQESSKVRIANQS